jgi:hypothetical protein
LFGLAFFLNWKSKQPLTPREQEQQRQEQEARYRARPWANDPIGDSIEWTELPGGGALEMHCVSDSRVEFRPGHPRPLYFILLLMTLGGAVATLSTDREGSGTHAVVCLLVGTGITFLLWQAIRLLNKPVVFDKLLGRFWEGGGHADQVEDGSGKCVGRIADIHAIQAITYHRLVTDKDGFTETRLADQLNLVMKDGARLVVSGRDAGGSLSHDATLLSEFLGKPLWTFT